MGLALKCDETEASRSENTLQNVKNYKITRKCQKKYIFAQTIFTHFLGQYPLMNFHRHIDSFLKKRGLVFEKRNLNRINSTIETNFYARLIFYRTAIDFNHK